MKALITDETNHQTASVISGFLASGLAVFYALARLGFAFQLGPLLVVLGLSYFVIFSPLTMGFLIERLFPDVRQTWIKTPALT